MANDPKSFLLTPELHGYLMAIMSSLDEHQAVLIAETQRLGDRTMLQIAPEQGPFMTMLTRMIGARHATSSSVPSRGSPRSVSSRVSPTTGPSSVATRAWSGLLSANSSGRPPVSITRSI